MQKCKISVLDRMSEWYHNSAGLKVIYIMGLRLDFHEESVSPIYYKEET